MRLHASRNLSPSLYFEKTVRIFINNILEIKREAGDLLEEEMVINEFLLSRCVHALKRIELSLKITLEGLASLNDLVHDLESLLLGNSWAEWVVSQVSSNSDSRGLDHSGILLGELSVLDTFSLHH